MQNPSYPPRQRHSPFQNKLEREQRKLQHQQQQPRQQQKKRSPKKSILKNSTKPKPKQDSIHDESSLLIPDIINDLEKSTLTQN